MRRRTITKIVNQARLYSDNRNQIDFFRTFTEALLKTPKRKSQPPFLEIGTRRGGTALLILLIVKKVFNRANVITVDPYGDKPYDDKPCQYGDKFYIHAKKLLANFSNHIHYHLTSKEFINIMDQIGYWRRGKYRRYSRFSFVYLDGSHFPATVKMEYKHLFPRLIKGGYILIDNTDLHGHQMRRFFYRQGRRKNAQVVNFNNYTLLKR